MIQRQEKLTKYKNSVVSEREMIGNHIYLQYVMSDYNPNDAKLRELDYFDIIQTAKSYLDEYKKQLVVLVEKEKKLKRAHVMYQKRRIKERRRGPIDMNRVQSNKLNNYSIPPRHLSFEDAEKKEILSNLVQSMERELGCPDCTTSLRHWIVYLKESKQTLPSVVDVFVSDVLDDSKSIVTVVFTHPSYPTPFRSSMTVGLMYYLYGDDMLSMIMSKACLSYGKIEKRRGDVQKYNKYENVP